MAPRKGKVQKEEQVSIGVQAKDGELIFGVAHIFASFNDTFVHITDLSGKLDFHYRYIFIIIANNINII